MMNSAITVVCVAAVFGWCIVPSIHIPAQRLTRLMERTYTAVPRIGLQSVLSHMMSALRNGSTALQALEDLSGYTYPTQQITVERTAAICEERRLRLESSQAAQQVAVEIQVACALSNTIGCETTRTLDVVIDAYKRAQLLRDLRKQALATPKATARLLAALPLLTIVLGEAMGSHPLEFLLGTGPGALCLIAAIAWYITGLLWLWRLMSALQESHAWYARPFRSTVYARLRSGKEMNHG